MSISRAVLEHFARSHDPHFFAEYAVLAIADHVYIGRMAIAAALRRLHDEAFASPTIDVHRVAIDDSEKYGLVEITLRGRHTGPLFGVPPSYCHVALPIVGVYELDQGEIRTGWLRVDLQVLTRVAPGPQCTPAQQAQTTVDRPRRRSVAHAPRSLSLAAPR